MYVLERMLKEILELDSAPFQHGFRALRKPASDGRMANAAPAGDIRLLGYDSTSPNF
jgi:hypothetical protein